MKYKIQFQYPRTGHWLQSSAYNETYSLLVVKRHVTDATKRTRLRYRVVDALNGSVVFTPSPSITPSGERAIKAATAIQKLGSRRSMKAIARIVQNAINAEMGR